MEIAILLGLLCAAIAVVYAAIHFTDDQSSADWKAEYKEKCSDPGDTVTFWGEVFQWVCAIFLGLVGFFLALVAMQWLEDSFKGK